MRVTHLSALPIALLPLLVAGCALDDPGAATSASDAVTLAPTFDKDRPAKRTKRERPATRDDGATDRERTGSAPPSPAASSSVAPGPTGSPSAPPTAAAGPAAASVADPRGDVSGAAPAYVDLTGARLARVATGYELRVAAAATYPGGIDDGSVLNVASFYDVDGDGRVDYEVWGTLADDGWSGSHRAPGGASFGDDSGVTVTGSGATVVLRFPASHLGGASVFRWAVAAEQGTYAQVAAGTTARDHAPAGTGSVAFPG